MNHFKWLNCDDRSQFANRVLGLLYVKYNGQLDDEYFRMELKIICDGLEEHIRNIYECIDQEIPLMAYNNVLCDGAKGYSEWEEYSDQLALDIIASNAHEFHGPK